MTCSDGSGSIYPTQRHFSAPFVNRFSREANKPGSSSSYATAISVPSDRSVAPISSDSASEDARRMLDDVNGLSSRMRNNRRRSQQTERRAAAYANRLARHTARLLQHMPNAVPAVRPIAGTGASSLRHYVLRHDHLEAPDRTRLLVVSSDGRIRICTVLSQGNGTRLWSDYEVSNPPIGLGLSVVFDGLSSLIVKLEGGVVAAEQETAERESALDVLIAASEAKLASVDSRLAPVEERRGTPANDEVFPKVPQRTPSGDLRSYGFEDRIAFGGVKSAH